GRVLRRQRRVELRPHPLPPPRRQRVPVRLTTLASRPSRRRDDDYDVLEDGEGVGRIFHLDAAVPEGRPRMWAAGHRRHMKRAAHGYAETREEAMAAFAKSWRRT